MAYVVFDREILDRLLNVLGNADGDLCFFLPFYEDTLGATSDIQDISARGLHASNIVAVDNDPVIRGYLRSVRLNGTDEYLEIPDNVLLTSISGGVDAAFSVGCAFNLHAVNAAIKCLIGRWDSTTPNFEWMLGLTALEYPCFRIADDSAGATGDEGREDQTAVAIDTWYVLIATYDGRGTADPKPGMNIYRYDGATHTWDDAVDDADIAGAGAYADMEDLAIATRIGASNTGGVAAEFFNGEIMMPCYTRRELSAADARRAALLMVEMMGL